MNEIIEDILNSNPTEEPPYKKQEGAKWPEKKIILKCNVWKCWTCHPNSPRLTYEQIQQIRIKMNNKKSPRRLKGCNHENCTYCQKQMIITNKYIQEFNDQLKEQYIKNQEYNNPANNSEPNRIQINNPAHNPIPPNESKINKITINKNKYNNIPLNNNNSSNNNPNSNISNKKFIISPPKI